MSDQPNFNTPFLSPFLSIVTITYRDPKGLAETLTSLERLNAQGIQWEHVIVDSSPEENTSILEKIPSGWPVVHSIEKPKGIYAALNAGARLARGEVVWFLNGGDKLKDVDLLGEILDHFKSDSKLDLIAGGVDLYRDGQYLYPRIPKNTLLKNILGSNHLCQQAVLYRRQTLLKVGEFDERFKLAADYHHYFRGYLAEIQSLFIPRVLVDYDMSGASTNVEKALAELAQVHREMAPRLSFPLGLLDQALALAEVKRVRIVKAVGSSKLGAPLRGAWLFLNRLGKKKN